MNTTNLKSPTVRISASDYPSVSERALWHLRTAFPKYYPALIRAYAAKPNFSAVVLVLEVPPAMQKQDVRATLSRAFDGAEVVGKGRSYSIALGCHKVDVTFISKNFQMARDYRDYNLLGSLVAKQARGLGFSLKDHGLYVPATDTQVERQLTCLWTETLEILGFSSSQWLGGFETLEDIFEFIAAGDYFMPSLYESHPAEGTAPDARLSVSKEFWRWLVAKGLDVSPAYPLPQDKAAYLPELLEGTLPPMRARNARGATRAT